MTITKRDPTILDGLPAMIEASERRGQHELVTSDQLPAEMHGDAKEVLEKRGVVFRGPSKGDALFVDVTLPEGWTKRVVFRGPSKGDALFVDVTLPEGWTKRGTNHAMWSELVDADGVVVAEIFFKAAFYDRRAFLNLKRTLR